ncbi:alpha-2-macroglobulin family protein [Roseateles sp. NT4]|uniref:alpha-2-macroglobulin family protein n=1 Tax=Roseateles sp. NT4 TaxID=3453715 RepID=UPI003EEB6305
MGHTACAGWVRRVVGGALALGALAAQAAEPMARVISFNPQGLVPAVQQIRATFSEPMLPLGKVAGPDPFEEACELEGDSHWVDDRTWVMDLKEQELAGQSCEFRVRADLRSLAGRAVAEPRVFRFQVPVLTDDVKRTIAEIFPQGGADWVTEDQVFLLRYSHPLGRTPPDVRCEVPGRPEAPVLRASAEERDAQKKRISWMHLPDNASEAVRCPFALPSGGKVTLRLVRGALKPQLLEFKVRPAPAVTVDCRRVAPQGDCAAGFPVSLRFNTVMPQALLQAIQVQGEGGWRAGKLSVQPANAYSSGSSEVSFAADTFKPAAEHRIRWPAPALADTAGRPLPRQRVPTSIRTLPVLGMAYFSAPDMAIRPLQADNPVPLHLQGLGFETVVREARLGNGDDVAADSELLRWIGVQQTSVGVGRFFWAGGRGSSRRYFSPHEAALPSTAAVLAQQPLGPAMPPDARRAQVNLKGAGLHVLELRAFAGRGGDASVEPVYDSVAVLLTRLAVHLKAAEESSAVWVTQVDSGAPVPGVSLRVYDCAGQLAWQGVSDARGLAMVGRKLSLRCGDGHYGGDVGVTVVARHNWPNGERDVSLANSRWGDGLLDTGSYRVADTWGPAAIQAHTVLDRTLFKPGETVAMRHLLRRETDTGLALPAAAELPTHTKILHNGSGKEWTVPISWGQPGDGTASFPLPADAPLGGYRVMLKLDEPAPHYGSSGRTTGQFSVEAFRLPAMLGRIDAPARKLIFGSTPALQLALHYADGGAAKNWPATLNVYAQNQRRSTAPEGYDGSGEMTGSHNYMPPPQPVQLLLHTQALQLDAQGRAQVALPVLPTLGQPYLLHAELSYQDPNGEAQTLSQDFDVQASSWTAGVRTVGPAVVQRPLELQGLLLDENGARLAGQTVRITAVHKARWDSDQVQSLGEVCQGVTDANGELRCSFVPPEGGQYQFTLTAADTAGRLAMARSAVAAPNDRTPPAQPLFAHANKPLYRVGEVAELSITSPFRRSRLWLTIERQGILESRLLELDAAQSRIQLPIPREWSGNVAVSLLALDASDVDRPSGVTAMATGIVPLVVSTDAHALRITVKPDRPRYQPRDNASVRIHVASPDSSPLPAVRRLSFVAVDEALLSLKDNPTWDLLARMLRPRLHGVQTASSLPMNPPVDAAAMRPSAETALMDMLLRAAERARDPLRLESAPAPVAARAAMAGEARLESVQVTGSRVAGADEAPAPSRKLLESLLIWQADVPLDDNGDAVVSIPIKDALSRFRLVAVASAGTDDFGTGSAVLDVVKDIQLTAGLPPQVRNGDRFAALVTVRNTSGGVIALQATARLAGQAALPAQPLRLAAGESRQISWMVRVPKDVKALDWTFAARESGGAKRQDVLEVSQQVEPAVPVTVQAATLSQVEGSFDVPAFGFDSAQASSARVSVQLLPSLAGNLGGVRDWLTAYPYRCLEQSASRAIGMHDRAAWDAAMASLPLYLDGDGLANYFPRDQSTNWQGSDTLTAYLLNVADISGWSIPDAERDRMLKALEGFAAGRLQRAFWAPRDDALARRVTAMATLARYQRLTAAQVEAVRIDPDEWTTGMLIDWLTVLRKTNATPAAQDAAQHALRARLSYQGRRMVFSTEARDYWWWLMSHGDVDAARLLLAVADLPDWKPDLPRLLSGLLSRQQKNGAWATTTANAWGTLAVDAFARALEPVPVAGETRISLGRQQQTFSWSDGGSKSLDAGLDKASDALHIQHQGPGAPWASVEVRAAVPLTQARFAGYRVSRSISPVQQKVAGQWHVGDILRVRLDIRAQADMSWVVVNDPVPAGASILGAGLGRDSAAAVAGEEGRLGAWPLYQARDFTSFKSFYRYVPRGEFSLEYTVRLNNPGQFVLPPTRVEAMYAPEVFGEVPNAVFAVEP